MTDKNEIFMPKIKKSTKCSKCGCAFVSNRETCPNCQSEVRNTAGQKKLPLFYYPIFIMFGIYILWELFALIFSTP